MDKKEKQTPEIQKPEKKKKNRLAEAFMKNYKYEGLFLLILAIIAIVLGTLILAGTLVIDENIPLLGDYPKAFAWFIVILGAASFGFSVWPYYKPSVEEVKRVNWPTWKKFAYDSMVVLLFIFVLSVFYALIDSGFSALTSWLIKVK